MAKAKRSKRTINDLKIMGPPPPRYSGFSKQKSEKGLDVVVIVFFFVFNVGFIFVAVTLNVIL
jgi:hypothetical protein